MSGDGPHNVGTWKRLPVTPELTIQLDEHPSDEDLMFLYRAVRHFNRTVGGHEPPRPVACYLRDGAGGIAGGVGGEFWGRSVHISALWIAETHRGQGLGATLLRQMEHYAAERGHRLAYVETLSYQARPFYEKQGYHVFGELEEIAEGCTLYFLRKSLA